MYLEINGPRRSGRTTTLVNHIAEYLNDNPMAQRVLVMCPNHQQSKVIINMIYNMHTSVKNMQKLHFVVANDVLRGTRWNAAFIDNADYVPQRVLEDLIHSIPTVMTTTEDKNVLPATD